MSTEQRALLNELERLRSADAAEELVQALLPEVGRAACYALCRNRLYVLNRFDAWRTSDGSACYECFQARRTCYHRAYNTSAKGRARRRRYWQDVEQDAQFHGLSTAEVRRQREQGINLGELRRFFTGGM